ncbi:MAG TPA: EcsC family protein [Nocardioides sp.]|uniref:EcsC family protein n=1 Tax=Nocardioides sp. TaxID=35761 RepID=UPI002ED9E991
MAGTTKKLATAVGTTLAPKLVALAPEASNSVIQHALHRAIVGAGPLPAAAAAAEKQLAEQKGNVDKAVREVIENHVALASLGGFATNLGGLVTAAVSLPANVTGLALIQCRMVAAIAHLRGYDVDDPRVRAAILTTLLGEEKVDRQVRKKRLPAPPMALATAPTHDPDLDRIVAAEVTAELLARVAGKRLATTVGKRIPVLGGVVGAGTDGWVTYRIGRYAAKELRQRPRA